MKQFKRIYIPFKNQEEVAESKNQEINFEKWVPIDDDDTKNADREIEILLNDGWKIVSSCPITGTFSLKSAFQEEVTNNFVFTDGIEVLLVKE
jgi:hypothetical protein